MGDFTNIISTLGYPIAMSLLMVLACKYIYDKERASLDKTIDKIGTLTEAVNHNSETLARLVDEIERGEK